jgi:glycosyltransferase involved in cell wall biosynthesis
MQGVESAPVPPAAPPRIALDLTPACGAWTGYGRYVHDLARSLHEAGAAPIGLWSGRGTPASTIDQWCRSQHRHGGGAVGRRWRLPATLREVGAEIYHATTLGEPIGAGWTGGVVVTVHDCWPLAPDAGVPDAERVAFADLLQRATTRAAVVICPSAYTADQVRLAGCQRPVRVVPHGLAPVPMLPPRPLDAPIEPYLLSIGALEPRKNLTVLAEAIRRLGKDAPPWVHLGPLRDDEDGRIRAAMTAAGCRWLGWRDDGERLAWVAYAHALAQPSRHEGFGYPPLEALQQAIPVVAQRAAALPEVLGDAALWVETPTAEAWAEALAGLWRDEALHHRLRADGKRRCAAFPLARMAEGHLDAYRAALAPA